MIGQQSDSEMTAMKTTLQKENDSGPPMEGQRWEHQVNDSQNMGQMIAEIAMVGFVFLVCALGTFFLRRKWMRQQRPDGSVKVASESQRDSHRDSHRAVMDSPHVGGISTSGITRIMSEPGIDVVTTRSVRSASRSPGMIDQDDTKGQYPILSQVPAQ